MTNSTPAVAPYQALGEPLTNGERLLLAVIAYFVVLKLIFAFGAFPTSDEAYYWTWGLHPAWSYFDHPPLHGWLLGLSKTAFGHNLFALRWMTLACLAINLLIFAHVARRIAGSSWRPIFLKSTAVYLASPLFGFFGSLAFHDYLLVTLTLASGCLFVSYFADVERSGQGRLGELLAAAFLLGLAGLTKYNAAYLGIAVAAVVATRPKLRRLLVSWELYVAGALALACQAPVLIWNAQNDFASLRFQLGTRHGETGFTELRLDRMKAMLAELLALVSPFLFPIALKFFWARQPLEFERIGKTLAIWLFWLALAVTLYVSNFSWVLWWWNITAFVLIFPFSGRYASNGLLTAHVIWGALLNTFLVISFAIVPLGNFVGGFARSETDLAYGWDQIAEVVEGALEEEDASFVATTRYQLAGMISFALDGQDVRELAERLTTIDAWFDDEAYRGTDAIVVFDGRDDDYWMTQFEDVERIGSIQTDRFGIPLTKYDIYVGRNYTPSE